jgi:lipopolysaccharide/colanic/teichoic acid biosynthesis glycosyltransferase
MTMLTKRAFDVISAGMALVVLSPVLLGVALAIRLRDGSPVLFRQRRVGRHGELFVLLKFRTMRPDAAPGGGLTIGDDPRVTPLGRFLRRHKVDELPQLVNVLKGDMSVVGPRPELEEFVAAYPDDYREILRLRPGLTDLASIKYRDEAALLAGSADPRRTYLEDVLPDKIRLAKEYLRTRSLALDLRVIARTLLRRDGS